MVRRELVAHIEDVARSIRSVGLIEDVRPVSLTQAAAIS
jgi:hypothetical protein